MRTGSSVGSAPLPLQSPLHPRLLHCFVPPTGYAPNRLCPWEGGTGPLFWGSSCPQVLSPPFCCPQRTQRLGHSPRALPASGAPTPSIHRPH